jgi:hypothetical protein
MLNRFVLNGANINRGKNPVRQIIKLAMTINVSLAETSLTMCQFTTPQTQIALGRAIAVHLLQPGFY